MLTQKKLTRKILKFSPHLLIIQKKICQVFTSIVVNYCFKKWGKLFFLKTMKYIYFFIEVDIFFLLEDVFVPFRSWLMQILRKGWTWAATILSPIPVFPLWMWTRTIRPSPFLNGDCRRTIRREANTKRKGRVHSSLFSFTITATIQQLPLF